MAIGRSRYAPPLVSSKGQSSMKQRSYALSTRTPPVSGVSRSGGLYDTRAEEHMLSDRVSNVNYLSNVLMDEGYDTALKSRGRDQQLLKEATNAIVSAESYATPQTSVASRRVARGQSVAPRAASVPPRSLRPEVDTTTTATVSQALPPSRPLVVLTGSAQRRKEDRATSVPPVVVYRDDRRQRAQPVAVSAREERRSVGRARSVPPAAAPSRQLGFYQAPVKRQPPLPVQPVRESLPTAGLRAHRVPRRFLTRTGYSNYYEGSSSLPYTLPQPRPAPLRESLRGFPQVYVPPRDQRPSNRAKAAIIASKMEPDPLKRRRPRSEYAATKYRELRRESMERPSGGASASSSALKSSYTRYSKTTEDDDDKPKSLLSWKYRLDSMLSPKDILYQPSSLIRIREQVKSAQEKMSRHREMLDKYLPESDSVDVAASIRLKMSAMERRDPGLQRRRKREVLEEETEVVTSEE